MKKEQILISVIMSVYNENDVVLQNAIESILKQSYESFEFIIVCDNPKNIVAQRLLQSYAFTDDRIILLFNENNIGLPKSLNKAIKIAKGKYIARMDADDISLPKRLETQLDYMEKNKFVDVCGCFAQDFGDSNAIRKLPLTNNEIIYYSIFGSPLIHPSVFIKTEILKKIQYDETALQGQDFILWCKLLIEGYKLANIPQVLLKYRVSKNQISSIKSYNQKKVGIKAKMFYREKMFLIKSLNLPDFVLTLEPNDCDQLEDSIYALLMMRQKTVGYDFIKDIIELQIFRLLINSCCLKFIRILKMLKRCNFLELDKKIIVVFAAIFKLSILKKYIQKNKLLTSFVCKTIRYTN